MLLAEGVRKGLQLPRVGTGLPLLLAHRILHYLVLLEFALVRGQRAAAASGLSYSDLVA